MPRQASHFISSWVQTIPKQHGPCVPELYLINTLHGGFLAKALSLPFDFDRL